MPVRQKLVGFLGLRRSILGLLAMVVLVGMGEHMAEQFLPLYLVALGGGFISVGFLNGMDNLLGALYSFPGGYLADRGNKKPFVVATFAFFTLFPLVLLHSRSVVLLIGAFVLRGLKEFGEPTRKALIMDLAPEDRKAGMFGLYYLIRDVIVSLAAFGGAYLWEISPEVNLLTAFGCGLAGTVWFAALGRDLGGRRPAATASSAGEPCGNKWFCGR
jgi:MFS family permease